MSISLINLPLIFYILFSEVADDKEQGVKKLAVVFVFLLTGCVDSGRIGLHPELQQLYLEGSPNEVAECLFSAAISQQFHLERDGGLSEGMAKYNLTDSHDEEVAWIEIAAADHKQSSVTIYHAKEAEVRSAISAMVARCKDARF